MLNYKDQDAKVFAKYENLKAAAGARAIGVGDKEGEASLLEANTNAGVYKGSFGAGVQAGAEAQVFNFKYDKADLGVKLLGVNVHGSAGFDLEALIKKDRIIGAEAKARVTMADCKAGPVGLHLGVGVSTAAKIEDGTFDAKVAGCGLKVGKTIGVSVFDNEFSINIGYIVDKLWPW